MDAVPAPDTRVRVLAASGLAGAGLAVVLVGLLHVVEAERVSPVRRTISEYALGEFRWMFDVGVLGLAAGSALVLAALVRAGLLRWSSGGAVLLAVWAVALVTVVAFEKANWSLGPSVGGYIHRYASLVAFVSLPAAALLLGLRRRGDAVWARFAGWSRRLALLSLAWLGVILVGFVLRPLTGVPWWQFVPIGLVERGLAVTEAAVVVVLGWWAWRAASVPGDVEGVEGGRSAAELGRSAA